MGIDGPKMSVSRMPALYPLRAKLRARFTAMGQDRDQGLGSGWHACNGAFPDSSFGGRDGDDLFHVSDASLLRQAALHARHLRRCARARQPLGDAISTADKVVCTPRRTRGFSCCRRRNVENRRGFMVALRWWRW